MELVLRKYLYRFVMHTKGHFADSLLDRHDVRGFKYWSDPGAFAEYKVKGDVGKFTGVWSTMIQAYVVTKISNQCFSLLWPNFWLIFNLGSTYFVAPNSLV